MILFRRNVHCNHLCEAVKKEASRKVAGSAIWHGDVHRHQLFQDDLPSAPNRRKTSRRFPEKFFDERSFAVFLTRLPLLMVRRKFVLLLLLLGSFFVQPETIAAQRGSDIPPFSMTLSTGQFFKAADLPKDRPVLLIYFSPDCDHCHTLMNAFFKRADDFKTAAVVLVTFKPLSEVAAFVQAYETFRYPNIKVGTEGTTNYLRNFYKLQNTPFTALYNKQGKLISSYRKITPLDAVAKQLKTLINVTS